MHFPAALFTILLAAARQTAAQCSSQQYNIPTGYPASNAGCSPLNYYASSALSFTTPTEAPTSCAAQCSSRGAACGGYVAQVNKVARSGFYSGNCYFFAPSSPPATPRQCSDKAYLLAAGTKDNTLQCLSSAPFSVSASQYCSSLLGIPVITSTVTSSTVLTVTAMFTTMPEVTSTQTVLATVTQRSATTSSTTSTLFDTIVSSTTTVTTVDETTIYTQPYQKRSSVGVAPPACVSDAPLTRLSSACSCLSVPTSTTTTTKTTTISTKTNTSTVSSPTTKTATVTRIGFTATATAVLVQSTSITVETTTTATTLTTTTSTTTTTVLAAPTCKGIASPYQAQNGKRFSLSCNAGYTGNLSNSVFRGAVADYKTCLDTCAGIPSCVYVSYYESGNIKYCDAFSISDGLNAQGDGFNAGMLISQ